MKLPRLSHDPSGLKGFFQEALESLGAITQTTWHDRLEILAEGRPARLWNPEESVVQTELRFCAAGESGPRLAETEVFPGCPLTFQLAELLMTPVLEFERIFLHVSEKFQAPSLQVAEKIWHVQFPHDARWRLESVLAPSFHFSLLVLVRCEIQAIDQHWSLHRVVLSLADGQPDPALATALDLCYAPELPEEVIPWPRPDPVCWQEWVKKALADEVSTDLATTRQRQENYLRRELERIDRYFLSYERELRTRLEHQHREEARTRVEQRIAAARIEHENRRLDQVQRHMIRVLPRVDALLMIAEPAWEADVSFIRNHEPRHERAVVVPRLRRWFPGSGVIQLTNS